MALKKSDNLATPVGRLVMGHPSRPRTTNDKGEPLVYKTGQQKGQPRSEYFLALAIPKGAEAQQPNGAFNWAHTPWGSVIYRAGCEFLAHAPQLPTFAWKVQDGDSTVPNKRGRRNCDTEGFPGCWVLFFSGSMPPKLCDNKGVQTPEAQIEGYIKTGYFVQVGFNCVGNESTESPGVYLNPLAVSLAGYGAEIFSGVDTQALGFGAAPLPAGASATPLAGMQLAAALPASQPIALPGMPTAVAQVPPPLSGAVQSVALPGMQSMQPATSVQLPGAGTALPPAIQPNAAFLQPVALTLPAALKPTQLAQGTIEQYRQQGYTDDQLIAAGVFTR